LDRRVVITGLGLITPLGTGTGKSWEALLQGRSGVGPITKFDASEFSVRIAAEVDDFVPEEWVSKKDLRKMDLFIPYALAASQMALEDAGVDDDLSEEERRRFGVLIGSGIGGLNVMEREFRTLTERGPRRMSPFFIPAMIINLASGHVSMKWGLKGPNSAVVTACATGAHAIGDAAQIIRRGEADAMVAGGTEGVICPLAVGGFASMRALSTRNDEPETASRPFSADRDGFVIGEGAGIVILEEEERARKRGARIYAEVAGYGMSGDAYHISAPHEEGHGAVQAMEAALEDAGLPPDQIGYINTHGTATPAGDVVEVRAIRRTFGDHADKLAVNSTKSMIGHLLGAAGGAEAIVTALTVHHGVVHPTTNLLEPDPECDLDFVTDGPREVPLTAGLSNSFGFGGTNAALVLKRYDG
jgi:3-oxoacyl-[acyl-carrier-protein] synthase II